MILEIIFCFFATFFYCLIMNSPKKVIVFSSINASLGYFIYLLCVKSGNIKLGFFLGTFIIAFIGELFARYFKMPATIFIFPAIIPIVPGLGLYQTILAFVQNDIPLALEYGTQSILNIGAMAIAMAWVSLLALKIRFIPKAYFF